MIDKRGQILKDQYEAFKRAYEGLKDRLLQGGEVASDFSDDTLTELDELMETANSIFTQIKEAGSHHTEELTAQAEDIIMALKRHFDTLALPYENVFETHP